ncbi:MAG: response regulator [Anaerolineae bacterium]|nr:response regulator [Anaerolineae bacterium]
MSTILIIEDSLVQALALKNALEDAGLTVLCATDGRQGLALADAQQPDAIVLDLEMPGMNGFEVCRELKANPQTASIPVIILTSHDEPEAFMEILESGARDFIVKDDYAYNVVLESLEQVKPPAAEEQVSDLLPETMPTSEPTDVVG